MSLVSMRYIKSLVPWTTFRSIHKTVKKELGIPIMREHAIRLSQRNDGFFKQGILSYEEEEEGKTIEVPYIQTNDPTKRYVEAVNVWNKNGTLIHIDGKPLNILCILLTGKISQ